MLLHQAHKYKDVLDLVLRDSEYWYWVLPQHIESWKFCEGDMKNIKKQKKGFLIPISDLIIYDYN